MLYGIGTDIVRVERITKAKQSFLEFAFTERELSELKGDSERLAGCFAAKEAFVKALGLGFREIGLKDIEIFHNDMGKPFIHLNDRFKEYSSLVFNVSISHEKEYAVAFVTAERVD
ncbi:MAG: holo-ACP synthase [Clostridiales bacterium]|nr:holo-ACP synthase [Clostridiales bacterium]